MEVAFVGKCVLGGRIGWILDVGVKRTPEDKGVAWAVLHDRDRDTVGTLIDVELKAWECPCSQDRSRVGD